MIIIIFQSRTIANKVRDGTNGTIFNLGSSEFLNRGGTKVDHEAIKNVLKIW